MTSVRCFAGLLLLGLLGLEVRGEPSSPTDRHGDPLPAGALARLGTVRLKHGGPVHCVIFSPDGQHLVSAGEDRVIRLWDAGTGKELRQFLGHEGPIRRLAFQPQGDVLASCGDDKTIRFWHTATGRPQPPVIHQDGPIDCVAFAPDGKTIAAGGNHPNAHIHLWNVATGKEVRRWKANQRGVWSLAYLPDGKTLFTGGCPQVHEDRNARADAYSLALWDATTGKKVRELNGHHSVVRGIAVAPDGKLLASAGGDTPEDGSVRLWETDSGRCLHVIREPLLEPTSVAFSPDGKVLAVGDFGKIHLIDVADGKPLRPMTDGRDLHTPALAFAPDGRSLVSASDDGLVLWDVARRTPRLEADSHSGPVTSVATAPDGKTVATGSNDGTARLWDLATGALLRTFRLSRRREPVVGCVAFAPDGMTLALGHRRQGVTLWEVATGKLLRQVREENRFEVVALAFAPDGQSLLADSLGDTDVRLLDPTTGQEVRKYPKKLTNACAVAFAPDGRCVAGQADGLYLWETQTGKLIRHIREATGSIAFTPDGLVLATGVQLWEAATGRKLGEMGGRVQQVVWKGATAFSPDGRLFAVAEEERVRVWDMTTGVEVRSLHGHRGKLTAVTFTTDGRRVVTGSEDGTALVWNVADLVRQPVQLTSDQVEALWATLKDTDRLKAYHAFRQLHEAPVAAVVLLKRELKAAAPAAPERTDRLLKDLNGPQFAARERATQELEKLGSAAERALRQALAERPLPEVRQRLERLLDLLDSSPDMRRGQWAVKLLERVRTADARRLLEELAQGDPQARQTQESKAALQRLANVR